MSNEVPKQISDALQGGPTSRRDFIQYTTGTAACISLGTLSFGCGSSTTPTRVNGYAIDSTVSTTLERTVVIVDRPSIGHTSRSSY